VANEPSDRTLEVTVLGCSGTFSAPGGACTGYLVRGGGRTVLLDCGPGTLANLQEHVCVRDLDAVVITHSHPDHWVELPVLRNVWKYVLRAEEQLPVFTTDETWSHAEVAAGGHLDDTFQQGVVHDASDVRIGPQRWRFSRTDHPVETLAVRVDINGHSFVFSADTGRKWSLEALSDADGIDLAFVESTFVDATFPGGVQHLTARLAGETAAAAGVRQLVLTHLLPGEDAGAHLAEARATFGRSPSAERLSVAEIHERYEA
jgi:ribonuclease BN (tRNA processing enzyme)